jgi:cobalt-zinc-cadmium efflux system outer membrane protein
MLVLLALLPLGCNALTQPPGLIPVQEYRAPEVPAAPAPEGPLSLEELLDVASANSPDLAIARARSEAAQGRLVQAGLYPNPTLTWEADEVGSPGGPGGTQGPIISQTIVTCGKLRYAERAAAAGVAAADWQAITRWYEVVTRVRTAYYDLLADLAEIQASKEIVRLANDALSAAKKLQAAGAGTLPDVLRAEVEVEQSKVRLSNAEERARAAWKVLAIAVGVPEMQHRAIAGSLEGAVPDYEWEPVVRVVLTRSSELQEAEANVGQAEQLVLRARAERVPNFTLSVRPFYSYPDHSSEVKIEAGAALPLFNRNQGNILAAVADLDRSREEVRQVELRLTERLTLAFQRYRQARQQADVFQRKVLKTAEESLRLVRLGYQRGDPKYDFTAVLQAQQTLAQARLAYVQSLRDLWRAAVEIAGLLQDEAPGCAAPAVADHPAPEPEAKSEAHTESPPPAHSPVPGVSRCWVKGVHSTPEQGPETAPLKERSPPTTASAAPAIVGAWPPVYAPADRAAPQPKPPGLLKLKLTEIRSLE